MVLLVPQELQKRISRAIIWPSAGVHALAKGEPNPNVPEKYFLESDFYDEFEELRNTLIKNWNDQTNECD